MNKCVLFQVRDRIVANDGSSIDVQAGPVYASFPKDSDGPYSLVQCADPQEKPSVNPVRYGVIKYDRDGVARCVPVELLIQWARKHGGVKDWGGWELFEEDGMLMLK